MRTLKLVFLVLGVLTGIELYSQIELMTFSDCLCNDNDAYPFNIITKSEAGPYSFNWQGANGYVSNRQIPYITAPGLYTVTVTNAYGCETILEAEIPACNPIQIESVTTVPGCGETPGSITVVASGGEGDLSYAWSNGAMAQNLAGIEAGEYTLTITDETTCNVLVETVILESLPEPVYTSPSATIPPTCIGENDGVIITGNIPGFNLHHYQWSDGEEGEGVRIRENMPAGEYCVTITHYESGCILEECFDLAPEGEQDVYPMVQSLSIQKTGGGFPVYKGEWINTSHDCLFYQGGMQELEEWQIEAMRNGEIAWDIEVVFNKPMDFAQLGFSSTGEEYTLDFVGNIGSTSIASDVVAQIVETSTITGNSDIIQVSGADLQGDLLFDLRAASNNLSNCAYIPILEEDCNWSPSIDPELVGQDDVHELSFSRCEDVVITDMGNGQYCASLEDGTTTGIYWSLPGGGQILSNCIAPPMAGEYCVVSNISGCSNTECFEYCPPLSFDDLFLVDMTLPCDYNNNGSICLRSRQGNRPITYVWGDGLESDCFENLVAGTYCVTITDYGCDFGQTELVECITLPASNSGTPLVVVPEVTPSCAGAADGEICLEVSGGYPGRYQYSWADGSITECLVGLAGGTCYDVTVTDECGQTLTQCIEVPEVASEPPLLGIDRAGWTCPGPPGSGGMIDLDFYGSLEPYTFLWDNGVNTWFSTSATLVDPSPGTYSITATDRCGGSYDLGTVEVGEPDFAYQLDYGLDDTYGAATFCQGRNLGYAEVSITENVPVDYEIRWGPGSVHLNELTRNSLPAITHQVTITELSPNSCEIVESFDIPQLGDWEVNYVVIQACGDGAQLGSATAQGLVIRDETGEEYHAGVSNVVDFRWDDGVTSIDRTDLSPGVYCYEGKNQYGCLISGCIEISAVPNPVIITREINMPPDGSIDIYALYNGASSSMRYHWSNDTYSADLQGIQEAGLYSVTVTSNETGCEAVEEYRLFDCETDPDYATFWVGDVTITPPGPSQDDASISIAVNPGSEDIYVKWRPWDEPWLPETNLTLEDLAPGYYCVEITDGCTTFENCYWIVNCEEFNWQIDFAIQNACDDGGTPGSIVAEDLVRLPGAPFSLSLTLDDIRSITWDDGNTELDRTSMTAGEHCYEVLLSTGCTFTGCINIEAVPSPIIEVNSISNPPAAHIDISTYNSESFEYAWSNGTTTQDISPTEAGEYTISVTNPDNGCITTATYDLQFCNWTGDYQAFEVDEVVVTPLGTSGGSDGRLQAMILPGSNTLYYHWTKVDDPSFHRYTATINNLTEGEYCLEVTDGCTTREFCRLIVFCGDYSYEPSFFFDKPCPVAGISESLRLGGISLFLLQEYGDETEFHWERLVQSGTSQAWHTVSRERSFETYDVGQYRVTITDLTTCAHTYMVDLESGIEVPSYFDRNNGDGECILGNRCNGVWYYSESAPHHTVFTSSGFQLMEDPCSVIITCPITSDVIADLVASDYNVQYLGPSEFEGWCNVRVTCFYNDTEFPVLTNSGLIYNPDQCVDTPILDDDDDNDSIPNGEDNCPTIWNPDQADGDDDGEGDVCDCDGGVLTEPDYDNDGIADACDECPYSDNDLDDDEDGIPDGCDQCPNGNDALDEDGDQIPDDCDDCPGNNNIDSDGDGTPDACDHCPTSGSQIDTDNDLLPDDCDKCPYTNLLDFDGQQLDSDGDGVGDACDPCPFTADPSIQNVNGANQTNAPEGVTFCDLDGNGIPDSCDGCPTGYQMFNGCCVPTPMPLQTANNDEEAQVAAATLPRQNDEVNDETEYLDSSFNAGRLSLSIFPNPADGSIVRYELELDDRFSGEMFILDLNGKIWSRKPVNGSPLQGKHTGFLLLQDIPEGLYFVKARSDSGQLITKKLVIQR